jgi:MFS transporter, DHA1 family, multidrug resistance protein B
MSFFNLHSNIRFRIVTIFLTTLTTNMIFPFMAIYFAKTIGPVQTSIFLSLSIIINLISSILGGNFADNYGRKKVMIFSDVIRVITFLMFALSNSPWYDWPYLTLVFFLINNICSGFYSPASEAMLLDVSTPENRKYMYGILYWISNLSIAIGGAIGAFFFNEHLFYLFIALSITGILSTLITMFLISETHFPNINQKKKRKTGSKNEIYSMFQSYKIIINDKLFLLFLFSSMLLFSLESHLANFISIRLEDEIEKTTLVPFNLEFSGIELLGLLRSENTICVVVFSVFATWLIKKQDEKTLIFSGFLMYVIGYGVLSFSNNPWILIGIMVVAVIGEVIAFPIHQSYMGDIIPDHLRSSYLALNRIAIKGSALIGTLCISFASILPVAYFSLFVWLSGLIGLIIFKLILPAIYDRRFDKETNASLKAN